MGLLIIANVRPTIHDYRMSLRFRKSVKILPGVRINFNKNSTSLSLGPRGAHYTMSSTGRRTVSAGIPGTGLYYSESANPRTQVARAAKPAASAEQDIHQFDGPTPTPGILSSRAEKDFYTFLNDVYGGDVPMTPQEIVTKAKELRAQHEKLNYALNILAFLYILNDDDYEDKVIEMGQGLWADRERAFADPIVLKYFRGIRPVTRITDGISAAEILNSQQFGFIWVEVLQAHEKFDDALTVLHEMDPDQLVGISMADIELSQKDYDALFETTDGITNEDDATAIMIVMRGIAFREKELYDASLECFKQALAKKSRSQQMLNRAHCERALTYQKMGKKAQARKDLELVLVNEPDNEDVAKLIADLDA